jgi:hypothetical protein
VTPNSGLFHPASSDPIPSHPIPSPSPSSCHRGFRAYPASRPLSSAHSLTQRPSSPVTMLGVPAGGSNRRKKGVMYSMGNVCVLSSLLTPHLPALPALPIRSVIFCACKYRVFFSGWGWRSDSARAECSVVVGCSANQRLAGGGEGTRTRLARTCTPRAIDPTGEKGRDNRSGVVGVVGVVGVAWLVVWSGWSGWESGTANATAMIQEPEAEVSACGGRATWGLSALRSTVGRLESVGPIGCRKTRRHSSESPDGPRRHMTCTFVAFLAPRRGVFGCRPCMS